MKHLVNAENTTERTEEEVFITNLVEALWDDYSDGGFDLDTEQSLGDVFKMVFESAVRMTIDAYDQAAEDHENDGQPDEQQEWHDFNPEA